MASITDVREAIAAAVATIDGLRATALVTDQVNPPQAMVWRKAWTYDDTMSDEPTITFMFGVTVYVGRTDERSGQDLLDLFAEPTGDKSVKQVIETDTDLAALCDYAVVVGVDEIKAVTVGQVDYLTEEFTVEAAI